MKDALSLSHICSDMSRAERLRRVPRPCMPILGSRANKAAAEPRERKCSVSWTDAVCPALARSAEKNRARRAKKRAATPPKAPRPGGGRGAAVGEPDAKRPDGQRGSRGRPQSGRRRAKRESDPDGAGKRDRTGSAQTGKGRAADRRGRPRSRQPRDSAALRRQSGPPGETAGPDDGPGAAPEGPRQGAKDEATGAAPAAAAAAPRMARAFKPPGIPQNGRDQRKRPAAKEGGPPKGGRPTRPPDAPSERTASALAPSALSKNGLCTSDPAGTIVERSRLLFAASAAILWEGTTVERCEGTSGRAVRLRQLAAPTEPPDLRDRAGLPTTDQTSVRA